MNNNRNLILKAFKYPTFFKKINDLNFIKDAATAKVCDERLEIGIKIYDKKIIDAYFFGDNLCLIATAVSQLILENIINQEINIVKKILLNFQAFLSQKNYNKNFLNNLSVFENIYKSNQSECANLPVSLLLKLIKKSI